MGEGWRKARQRDVFRFRKSEELGQQVLIGDVGCLSIFPRPTFVISTWIALSEGRMKRQVTNRERENL